MPMASSSAAVLPLAPAARPSSSSFPTTTAAPAAASKPPRPSTTPLVNKAPTTATTSSSVATAPAAADVIATLHLRTDTHCSATGSDVYVKVHIASTTVAALLHFVHRDCFALFAKLPLSMILEDDAMRITHVTPVPIPAGLYLPNHTVVDANVSRVAHLCMAVGSTFTLKLLHATHQRNGGAGAGVGEASHTHLRTVLLTLVGLDRIGIGTDNGRLLKQLPSKWTVSSGVRSDVALPGIAKKGYKNNKKTGKNKHQNGVMNSKKDKTIVKTTPTPFGSGIGNGFGLDEDLNITADQRYPNLSAVLFGDDMQHKETLVLFHPTAGSLAQNDEVRQVLQLAWAPEPFSCAGKTMQALDQACARRDRSVTFNWTARVVYSDCNSKRRVRRQSAGEASPVQTFRFDCGDGDDFSEGVLEARFPQCGRAHDTGGWLVYDRGVLRACRGVGGEEEEEEEEEEEGVGRKKVMKKKNGGEAEVVQVRESVVPLHAEVQIVGSRRKRFRSLDELLMVAEKLWEQET